MPYRIDLDTVRDVYRNMGDDHLLSFAREEGLHLTTDAYEVLKQELASRNIGWDIINGIEHEIILQYGLRQKKFQEDLGKDLFAASVDYALTEKHAGSSRYDIYAGLIERGIPEESSNYIINRLDEWAASLKNDAVGSIVTAIGMLLAGVALLAVNARTGRFGYPGVFLLLCGLIALVRSIDSKRKYSRILDYCRMEEELHNRRRVPD